MCTTMVTGSVQNVHLELACSAVRANNEMRQFFAMALTQYPL